MPVNPTIENLSQIVEFGDVKRVVGGDAAPSENAVVREMKNNGMEQDQDGSKTFSDVFRNSMDKVNTYQAQADQAIKELVAGRSKNIHETMLAIERADTSLKLMMQVRNKVLDAYREIMRMQV
jgi:flagellar hook-basal body complex protein FliE